MEVTIHDDLAVVFPAEGKGKTAETLANIQLAVTEEGKDREVINILPGFETDFASVPRLFRGFVGRVGRHVVAAVIHDYLCVKANEGKYDRDRADKIFLAAMESQGVYWYRRYPVYWAVAAYAKTIWRWTR